MNVDGNNTFNQCGEIHQLSRSVAEQVYVMRLQEGSFKRLVEWLNTSHC